MLLGPVATRADRASALSAAFAAALAAALAFSFLGDKGFWLDEALSVQRASGGWPALWRDITGSQANMSLYYVLLHWWIALGDSEAVVRGLSALFAVATVPVVYRLTTRLFNARAAIAAALLLALNSFFISYAQEARGYSLAILLSATATWRFVIAVEHPSPRSWVWYAVAASVALYAHFFCALVLLAHAASLPFTHRAHRPWRSALPAGAIIGLAGLPLLSFVAFRDVGQIDWVPAPRLIDLYNLFATFAGGGWWLPALAGLAIVSALALAARRQAEDALDRWRLAVVVCWFVIPPVLAFVVSAAKPVFQPRFLIVSLVPFVMLVAAGLARLRHRVVFASAFAVIAVLSGHSVRAWYDAPDKQWWRAAAQHVSSQAAPGDALGFYVYSARAPFEYYARRQGLADGRVTFVDLASSAFVAANRPPEPSSERLRALASTHPRVWLVRLQDGTPPGHPLGRFEQSRAIEAALAANYRLVQQTPFPGGIRVQLYERTAR